VHARTGELSVNGPDPRSATFKMFLQRGWADFAHDAQGRPTNDWTRLRNGIIDRAIAALRASQQLRRHDEILP
jgi:hypothetical protein